MPGSSARRASFEASKEFSDGFRALPAIPAGVPRHHDAGDPLGVLSSNRYVEAGSPTAYHYRNLNHLSHLSSLLTLTTLRHLLYIGRAGNMGFDIGHRNDCCVGPSSER